MAQTREVTQTRQVGVTPSGKQVVKSRTQVSSPEAEEVQNIFTLTNLVYYFSAVLEVLLGFRLILKLLGANPVSWFVSFIYNLSAPFEYPFRGIFRSSVTEGIEVRSVLEPSTVVAILVYALLAAGIAELIKILTATNEE